MANSIRLNNVDSGGYKPTKLRIDSIGVGISDETNDSLRLDYTQHMIVGERLITAGSNVTKSYGLIVDKEGIAVNTTVDERARMKGQYSMYVDGSIFVSGAVVACNLMNSSNIGVADSNLFWKMASFETENIYYDGKVTLGVDSSARHNEHTFSIVQSADRTIDRAQISIQNTQQSQLRVGIVGTSNISPAVVNTSAGVPLEFHAGRGQSHFAQTYLRSYWEDGSNITVPAEVPRYVASNAPHMIIAPDGAVGIRTDHNPVLSYELRIPVPGQSNVMSFPRVEEKMALHVNGPLFASNLLIQDYETGLPDNIDRLYVRRKGVTFEANQVIPGPFANGVYTFLSNVAIAGPAEEAFQLRINGAERITEYLQVDGFSRLNRIEVNDAVLLDVASFCNDVYMQSDVIVKESLRLRGGLFTEVIDGSNSYWCNVQFTVSGAPFSNINYYGLGFTTPGRVGVGIDPRADEVNNQLVVIKRSADIYELELHDKTSSKLYKAAYIGHPPSSNAADASLVIATPDHRNPNYNRGEYSSAPQNIYFFPGGYSNFVYPPIISTSNLPTLNVYNVFNQKRVGILTYTPEYTLDVNGDIRFNGDLYQGTNKLGVWRDRVLPNIYVTGGPTPNYRGIEYVNASAPHVGVNMQSDPRYGMIVSGGIKSMNGYYTEDDRIIVPWLDSVTSSNIADATTIESMFTQRNVGIGVKTPTAMLDVRNRLARSTVLRLNSPERNIEYTPMNQIQFAGLNDPWVIQGNDTLRRLEFAYGLCNVSASASNRAMWMHWSPTLLRHQVIINGNENYLGSNGVPNIAAALLVNGDMSVHGDVSISGRYIINGETLVNSNIQGGSNLTLTNDDVFIGGSRIFLNPQSMVAVGYTETILNTNSEISSSAPFRVFNSSTTNSTLARLRTVGTEGYLEMVGASTQLGIRLGFRQNNATGVHFAFEDITGSKAFITVSSNIETGQNYAAFNVEGGTTPTASLHVFSDHVGCNMLRLTQRLATDDIAERASQLELEKEITTVSSIDRKRWVLHGPESSYRNKLSFRYGEGAIGNASERFCFTDNGCIGIGNSRPEFALDVAATGKAGTLRLYNSTDDPLPQIVLQSGSNFYGADLQTDYRIYSFSNNLVIDSVNSNQTKDLLRFGESGTVGINTAPNSNYDVNIGGVLNVSQAILLNGSPLFNVEGSEEQEGFSIRAVNIFLRPRADAEYGGGIVVNRYEATCNLFHIFNGWNQNMMVYDSLDSEAQVHFRTPTVEGGNDFSMYRLAMSNQTFNLLHQPVSASNGSYVSDSAEGYCNVVRWAPSITSSGEYDTYLFGNPTINANIPTITFKDANTTISASNQSLRLDATGGVGIGTMTPLAQLHVAHSSLSLSNVPAVTIDQSSSVVTAGASTLVKIASSSTDRVTIRSDGRVGIGTTLPKSALHLIDELRITDTSGAAQGRMIFGDSNVGTGRGQLVSTLTHVNDYVMYNLTGAGSLGFVTNSAERMRIAPSGNVGIGTTAPLAPFDAFGSNTTTAAKLTQTGTGDILQVYGSNISPTVVVRDGRVGINTSAPDSACHIVGTTTLAGDFLPSSNEIYDLGSLTRRWRDIYLSGNTIDLGGTTIRRTFTSNENEIVYGDLEIRDIGTTELRSIVVNKIRLKSNDSDKELYLEQGTVEPFIFVSYDPTTEEREEFVPFAQSSLSGGISIGVANPEATLHISSTSDTTGTAIFNHSGTASNCFVAQIGEQDKLIVQTTGNVGVGTSFAKSPFYVFGSNELPHTIARFEQGGGGNIVTFGTPADVHAVIASQGNVGIGTTLPQSRLHVVGEQLFDGETNFTQKVWAAQDVEVQGNTITHGDATTDSDLRLKSDLARIEGALEKVKALTGYTFKKRDSPKRTTGLIAQDVQTVLPEVVYENEDTLSVAYGNMMGLIVEAIKDLATEIEGIKHRI